MSALFLLISQLTKPTYLIVSIKFLLHAPNAKPLRPSHLFYCYFGPTILAIKKKRKVLTGYFIL